MTRSAICDLNRRDLWGCGDRRTLVALLVYGVFSKAASKALRSKRISNFENTPWNKTNELQVQVIRRLADLGLSNSPALILRLNEKKANELGLCVVCSRKFDATKKTKLQGVC